MSTEEQIHDLIRAAKTCLDMAASLNDNWYMYMPLLDGRIATAQEYTDRAHHIIDARFDYLR